MTETTQPDPQVEPDDDPRRDALRCIECEFRTDDSPGGWFELTEHRDATGHRCEHVRPASKPLTVADIPAGQGPASLFILSDDDGQPGVWHKDGDGRVHAVHRRPFPHYAGDDALWDHLAATLPHVTDEETP